MKAPLSRCWQVLRYMANAGHASRSSSRPLEPSAEVKTKEIRVALLNCLAWRAVLADCEVTKVLLSTIVHAGLERKDLRREGGDLGDTAQVTKVPGWFCQVVCHLGEVRGGERT